MTGTAVRNSAVKDGNVNGIGTTKKLADDTLRMRDKASAKIWSTNTYMEKVGEMQKSN